MVVLLTSLGSGKSTSHGEVSVDRRSGGSGRTSSWAGEEEKNSAKVVLSSSVRSWTKLEENPPSKSNGNAKYLEMTSLTGSRGYSSTKGKRRRPRWWIQQCGMFDGTGLRRQVPVDLAVGSSVANYAILVPEQPNTRKIKDPSKLVTNPQEQRQTRTRQFSVPQLTVGPASCEKRMLTGSGISDGQGQGEMLAIADEVEKNPDKAVPSSSGGPRRAQQCGMLDGTGLRRQVPVDLSVGSSGSSITNNVILVPEQPNARTIKDPSKVVTNLQEQWQTRIRQFSVPQLTIGPASSEKQMLTGSRIDGGLGQGEMLAVADEVEKNPDKGVLSSSGGTRRAQQCGILNVTCLRRQVLVDLAVGSSGLIILDLEQSNTRTVKDPSKVSIQMTLQLRSERVPCMSTVENQVSL